MSGVPEGKIKFTDKATLDVFGTLSPENNGEFASVRSPNVLINRIADEPDATIVEHRVHALECRATRFSVGKR
jgi:hypothetical protein